VSHEVAEDACSVAWLQFLRHQPDREYAVAWLYTVAKHEVFAALRHRQRDRPTDVLPQVPSGRSTEAAYEAKEAVGELRQLKPQQRLVLYMRAQGYSYQEIVRSADARTRGSTATSPRAGAMPAGGSRSDDERPSQRGRGGGSECHRTQAGEEARGVHGRRIERELVACVEEGLIRLIDRRADSSGDDDQREVEPRLGSIDEAAAVAEDYVRLSRELGRSAMPDAWW